MILNGFRTLLFVFALVLPPAGMVDQAAKDVGITAALSPAHPTVGATKVSIKGTASAAATVSDTSTYPDGTVHIFSFKAESDGSYTDGPFVLQQLGTFRDVLQDRATGASTTISYKGLGDFVVAVDPASRKVAKGQTATFIVTFTGVSGFEGTVVPGPLNGLHIPGATAWWAEPLVIIPQKSSGIATLKIRTSSNTPDGTYGDITLGGANGSVTHTAPSKISLTVH